MTSAKKVLYTRLITCVVGIAGGLMLGHLVKGHHALLAAIDLICTFGIALWLIILTEAFEKQ